MDKSKTQFVKKMTFNCGTGGHEVTGPAFLNMRKAYCLDHYLKLFKNPDTEAIKNAGKE